MRRGHSGIGGWRNENPRHFWPRGGGVPRHGPPQQYPLLDLPAKYGGPPRLNRGGQHYHHMGPNHHMRGVDRHSFGPHDNRPRFPGSTDRFNYPPSSHLRIDNTSDASNYKNLVNYCESRKNDQGRINSMGDVDHRPNFNLPQNQKPYGPHPISPWSNPPMNDRRISYDDRGHRRSSQYHDNVDGNMPSTFTSHRPPSSDHYGTNVSSAIDNSNSFSRSVDDTVDIVRRRLLNRNESHNSDPTPDQNLSERTDIEAASTTSYQSEPQTPPTRKRIQRQRQNTQSNCDKIKNKIVHQLFKMDKEKLNKLMDNPNSSSKFEYAISSLITESQNSLDRHLRSVAEKSLCTSSTEFIHDDNNTIYEDTFLKQMQCILEPQDTVLLEDIKPLVMAELNKVLQLDEFDQRFERGDDDPHYYPAEELPSNTDYPNNYGYDNADFTEDVQDAQNYPEDDNNYYEDRQFSPSNFPEQDTPESPRGHEQNKQYNYDQPAQLFERRAARKSCDYSELKKKSAESRQQARRSMDEERNRFNEARRKLVTPPPVFDTNIEQLSEEEDPFADLDKQYHVAVDHNFIEAELDKQYMAATEKNIVKTEAVVKTQLISSVKDIAPNIPIKKEVLLSPEIDPTTIKKEIDNQLLTIAKSPLKLSSSSNRSRRRHRSSHSKSENKKDDSDLSIHDKSRENDNHELNTENKNHESKPEVTDSQETVKSENSSTVKTTIASNSRKRSIDQKPSHRKEKRKKSDVSPEPNKQILNKNIIINVNDCGSNSTEKKCDAAKSIFNLFFSKDESGKELPKENKHVESSDKGYSDKYVKRKETPKKKEIDSKRKRSTSNSHSIVSPKDTSSSCSETQAKPDAKNKLKTIDMFLSHPTKVSNVHQAHRNTAQAIVLKNEEKPQPTKSGKRNVGTQMILKSRNKETQTTLSKSSVSRLCQTEMKKLATKAIQTDPVAFEKSQIKSNDAFERMKEIDLEIQVLLQEKFKLYNSLETKETSSNAMQNLGMTVVNVTPNEDIKDEDEDNDDANDDGLSEDAIVDNFTSIPVEELEQIALESVQDVTVESPKKTKRSKRRAVLERQRKNSQSPTVRNKGSKKAAPPSISLIEQIITDDRPLEDIISLDDFEDLEETIPVTKKTKCNKKAQKSQKSKKQPAKKTKAGKPHVNLSEFTLKECKVVLVKEDFSKYLTTGTREPLEQKPVEQPKEPAIVKVVVKVSEPETQKEVIEVPDVVEHSEQTVVDPTDMLDMLDVSEDIVIGDNCEVKAGEKETERVSIGEDVIVDNSQSSTDDCVAAEQSDNECKMFDYSSDEALKRESITVTGNADAVLAIEAIDNNFVAACLDGNVYHFNGDGQLLTTLRGSNLAVTCLIIVKEKYGTTVYTGSLDSRIRYYDLETGLEKGPECNVLSPIQTMDRAWDTVYVGTRTGFVTQYECKNNMLIPRSTMKFSDQSILALRALKEGPRKVLLVAARSENVTIKDAQTGLLMRTLEGPRMTVYTLVFEDGKVYCGTSSHQIHVFDYASGSHYGTHEGGKGAVCLRATGGLLFAGCYDGCVYIYREGGVRPLAQLRGPALMLLSLAVVGTKIIAGYKDRSLYIWKIPLSILKEMIL